MVSVVIPMYNEELNIARTLEELNNALSASGLDYEIIFSNDGSTDASADIVSEYASSHSGIRLVGGSENHGKGHAVRQGVLAANGEHIVFTDCDLAYGTDNIIKMLSELESSEYDLVIGSRAICRTGYEGYTFFRKIASKCYLAFIKLACGFSQTDSQCGIKGFKREAAKRIFSFCETDGFAFDLEVLMLASAFHYSIKEMPVSICRHSEATSKISPLKDAFKMLSNIGKIKKHVRSVSKTDPYDING